MSDAEHSLQELHTQTARIAWQELEPHFARGVVLHVADELDMVAVATGMANDDKAVVERWMAAGQLAHLDNETATRWSQEATDLWAVVVAPWVLVQEAGG